MRDGITPEQVRLLEAILDITGDRDEVNAKIAARVSRLIRDKERSQMSTVGRLRQLLLGRKAQREQERRQRLIRLRLEATRRGTLILIALRRHKEETGVWPETLDHIEPKLPEEMLTDPQNKGPFVYRLSGDSLVFYSKGSNGKDEGGSPSRPADDYPMWPLKIKQSR